MSEEIKNITPEVGDAPAPSDTGQAGFHEFPEQPERKFSLPKFKFSGKRLRIAGAAAGILLLFLIVFGALPAFSAYNSFKKLMVYGQEFKEASQQQDLGQMQGSLGKVKEELHSLNRTLGWLSWSRFIPFLGGYWSDAKSATVGGIAGAEAGEILITTIEPYSDILGFNSEEEAGNGAKTAEERINFIVETIDEIIPKLDDISQKTSIMASEFGKINPDRYPEFFRGKPLRSQIKRGINLVRDMDSLVTNGKPVLERAPYLLGIEEERTYLFIWQNDKELRPTGGFITAYSIVKVEKGKFKPVSSNDIYNLDNRFNSRIPAPEPIKKYFPLVPYWYLRDMNLSPDFKTSMDTFSENYAKIRSTDEIDAIVAMDTHPLVDLLEVMGPIGVPGFGNFSAEEDPRCNCPQVIYELESFADVAGPIIWAEDLGGKIILRPPHADNRKVILGPLMNSIVANAMGQPKEKLPDLFQAGWKALQEKHLLVYFLDEEIQKAMEEFNLAGRVREYNGDYLHINDSNFAGAKSNLYVEQEVELKVEPKKDGSVNTLKIRYKNPQKHDGWLNGPFRDWLRVYVPKGSELIDSTGSDEPAITYEDLGKTVFEAFFILRPEGVIELTFQYKTPVNPPAGGGDYSILIQKQPGKDAPLYMLGVDKKKEEFKLESDRELRF